MSKSLIFHLKYQLFILLLVCQGANAAPAKLDDFLKDDTLWKSSYKEFTAKHSDIDWDKNDDPNLFTNEEKGMSFLGRPVQKIRLRRSPDKGLVTSLQMLVVDEAQSKKLSDNAFNDQAKMWRDLVSKKLKKSSMQMPGIQIGDDEYIRLAWKNAHSTIILCVITNDEAKRIELHYHEQKFGIARLRLEGVQEGEEVAAKSDTENESESNNPTKVVNSDLSRSNTPSIVKTYKIKENFTGEWPKLVKTESPEITIIKEDEEENVFIYHSPNYEFICDVQISKNVIKNFSTLFEATRLYCQQMPILMVRAHMPENTVKFKILLFGTEASYFKNGGPQGSAGVYMSGKGIIMVPLSSLGVKKVGSSYMFDYKVSNKTLPHEITHQLTNIEYFNPGARGWFSEGLAEYVAATAYRSGKFMVSGNFNDIRSYVTEGSRKDGRGRYLGDEFSAPDIKQYMMMSYASFTANGNFNYGLGALITYYFMHMENDGDRKNINAFLTALNEGKQGEEALKVLLAGRTFDELEEEISKAWSGRGVKIKFN